MRPKGWRPARLLQKAATGLLEHIDVDPEWLDAARRCAERGPIVYVLRNTSALDFIALSHVTSSHDLPPIGFVNELPQALRPDPHSNLSSAEAIRKTLERGHSAVLFVKERPRTLSGGHRGRSEGAALLEELLRHQTSDESREIMMLPLTFVWTKRPEKRGVSVVDSLFGPADSPGDMRQVFQFLANYRNAMLRTGEPLSLRNFVEKQSDTAVSSAKVRQLTYALLRKVERQRRTIVGPARKAPDRVREEVLRSPKLQSVIADLAGPNITQRALLTDKAREILRQMQTIQDPQTQRGIESVANRVLDRVYAGIDVDLEGIERLREASQQGSVILLPSHKSHIDYVVLSVALRQHAIQLPVIAAGENLSFFPAGPLLRRAGAFFIRRSFRRDRLYVAVIDAYLRRLMKDGWIIEFFLEGGRSRTGKLLAPMLGLLNLVVASGLQLERRKVTFMPVSIGYERLMEEGVYARELSGEDKTPESLGELLKLPRVLRDRWGRLNIQFGETISLQQLRQDAGVTSTANVPPAKRRSIVKRLAHLVMAEINRVTALTPGALVALVLLGHGKRGVAYRDLVAWCKQVGNRALNRGARGTPTLFDEEDPKTVAESGLRDALRLYVNSGLIEQHVPGDTLTAEEKQRARLYTGSDVIYTIADNKRLRLDLPKNTIMHWFVDRALIALALRALAPSKEERRYGVVESELRAHVLTLSRLFKYDFMFRADADFDDIFNEEITSMVHDRELVRNDERIGVVDDEKDEAEQWIQFYLGTVCNFVEAYRIAARALDNLDRGPLERADLLKKMLHTGERMFLQGEIERSEAVSRPLFDNAISAFKDQGYLTARNDRFALADSFASESARAGIEQSIASYLPSAKR